MRPTFAVALLAAVLSNSCFGLAAEPLAVEQLTQIVSLPADQAALAISQAQDPSDAIAIYAAAQQPAAGDLALDRAFMWRMVEFGMPEAASRQAKLIVATDPTDGAAWAVLSRLDAGAGRIESSMKRAVIATRFAPNDAFALATAAEVLAWYDAQPTKPELAGETLDAIKTLRVSLADNEAFQATYQQALVVYVAAAEQLAAEAAVVASEPAGAPTTTPREFATEVVTEPLFSPDALADWPGLTGESHIAAQPPVYIESSPVYVEAPPVIIYEQPQIVYAEPVYVPIISFDLLFRFDRRGHYYRDWYDVNDFRRRPLVLMSGRVPFGRRRPFDHPFDRPFDRFDRDDRTDRFPEPLLDGRPRDRQDRPAGPGNRLTGPTRPAQPTIDIPSRATLPARTISLTAPSRSVRRPPLPGSIAQPSRTISRPTARSTKPTIRIRPLSPASRPTAPARIGRPTISVPTLSKPTVRVTPRAPAVTSSPIRTVRPSLPTIRPSRPVRPRIIQPVIRPSRPTIRPLTPTRTPLPTIRQTAPRVQSVAPAVRSRPTVRPRVVRPSVVRPSVSTPRVRATRPSRATVAPRVTTPSVRTTKPSRPTVAPRITSTPSRSRTVAGTSLPAKRPTAPARSSAGRARSRPVPKRK